MSVRKRYLVNLLALGKKWVGFLSNFLQQNKFQMYQRFKHKKIIRMGKLGVKQKLCLSGYNTLETTQVSIKVKQINT